MGLFIFQLITPPRHTRRIYRNKQNDLLKRLWRPGCSLNMISRQTKMAARAPMLSLSVCPSWMSSQFSPQYPSGQMQRYRSRGSRFWHVPPLRQGRSRHSSLSMQSLLSGDMTRPSPQLYTVTHSRFRHADRGGWDERWGWEGKGFRMGFFR